MRRSALLLVVLLTLALCCTAFAQKKSITLPPGTTVEKLGPGHFKFTLPSRQVVEVKDFNVKAGTVGFVSIIDPAPPDKPGPAGIIEPDPPSKAAAAAKPGKKLGPATVIDPEPPSRPRVMGKQGTLKTRTLTRAEAAKVPRTSYVEIDDEVTWLPITITFQPGR